MRLKPLRESKDAVVDLSIVIMIGIVFAALMVIAYINFTLKDTLVPVAPSATTTAAYNKTYNTIGNVTVGMDSAFNLILVAITIFILALAIAALLMLRGRR
jgi:hypothetical protein